MPGNDFHGGFASHIVVPARFLTLVPDAALTDHSLAELAVIADAVSTPYQVIVKSELQPGDFAVVIGVGGIGRGTDAIEFLMVGASAVGICTAAILRGPGVFGKIAREMDEWLDKHGYRSVREVQGLAIRRWQERKFRATHVPPELDVDTCNGCGLCETSCVYDAIHVIDKKATLRLERCYGCGLCVDVCPEGAVGMVIR